MPTPEEVVGRVLGDYGKEAGEKPLKDVCPECGQPYYEGKHKKH